MNTRKIVSALALSVAVLLGTTGCSFTHDVASLQDYAPSDGSQINIGAVKLRNFIYLTRGDGTGKLIGSVVNAGTKESTVTLQYSGFDSTVSTPEFVVPAGESYQFGATPENESLALSIEAKPGANVQIWVSVNGDSVKGLTVPVLDGSLEQYAPYFTD
jgi:hypothetical protein